MSKITQIALDAFRTKDWITGTITGGIEAPRKIISFRDDENTVEINYTYPETSGLSDCRYHDTRAGQVFTDTYVFNGDKITCNGSSDIFGIAPTEAWKVEREEQEMADNFYKKWNLAA